MTPDLSKTLASFEKNFQGIDTRPITKALTLSLEFYANQRRESGEPYIVHPVSVAEIVAELGMDRDSICAALFHDIAPDGQHLKMIREKISPQCAFYVERLNEVRRIRPERPLEKEMEGYRKMVLAVSQDLRVTLIRIADRLDNMRTIGNLPHEQQQRVAREVRLLYVPLANRMGLSAVKSELETLCFEVLEPEDYIALEEAVRAIEKSRKAYVDEVVKILTEKLGMEGYTPTVYGRPKHLYSIYLKMKQKGKSLEQIHDILAFRVTCETAQQCYGILGVIHGIFKPFPKLFKDYIALPKPNGYQSLHTSVQGPSDRRIEIQIRTREMHEIAEKGVAAHWLYKERFKKNRMESGRFKAISNTADLLTTRESEGDFWSLASFSSEIFLFTPTGELVVLPEGGTPIDFAFAVHSQVGSHCTGCRVNGAMVALRSTLHTWDTVEIITSANQRPNPDWLAFVVTSKARNKIKHHVRTIKREASRAEGRLLLERALKKHKLSFSRLLKEGAFERGARELKFMNQEDLFMSVGDKKLTVEKVLAVAVPELAEKAQEPHKRDTPKKKKKSKGKSGPPIEVDGLKNVLIRFAQCCAALPGEPIKGYVTRGRGVTIHLANCQRLTGMDAERIVPARWLVDPSLGDPVVLKVIADNRPGLLAKMSDVFAKQAQNIQRIGMEELKSSRTAVFFHFNSTKPMTDNLVRNLRKVKGVYSVSRSRNI